MIYKTRDRAIRLEGMRRVTVTQRLGRRTAPTRSTPSLMWVRNVRVTGQGGGERGSLARTLGKAMDIPGLR